MRASLASPPCLSPSPRLFWAAGDVRPPLRQGEIGNRNDFNLHFSSPTQEFLSFSSLFSSLIGQGWLAPGPRILLSLPPQHQHHRCQRIYRDSGNPSAGSHVCVPSASQTEPCTQPWEVLIFIFTTMLVSSWNIDLDRERQGHPMKDCPLCQPPSHLQLASHKRLQVHI